MMSGFFTRPVQALLFLSGVLALSLPSQELVAQERFQRLVRQIDYLDAPSAFQPAWEALRRKLPSGAQFFSITIEANQIAVLVATTAGLDRWTVRRARFLGLFDRDIVAGPQPVRAPTPGFRAALFDLDDVALDRLEHLVDLAIVRAALDDPARVTTIEIGSPQIVLPSPHYGQLRFSLRVNSGRESATVFALPDGTIVAADLSQTNRAARLDLLASDDWPMQDAQQALTLVAGPDAIIRTVEIGRKRVTLRRDNSTNPAAADFLSWDLSGARRVAIPTLNPARDGLDYLPFRLDEVDLTKLPEVKKNALSAFGIDGAVITDITGKKKLSPQGHASSKVVWHVTAQFPNTPANPLGPWADSDELGLAQVTVDGTVLNVRLPKRLRPPIDWFSGEGLVLTLKELRDTFGENARVQEVRVGDGSAQITMEDPSTPGTSIGLKFDGSGLELSNFSNSSMTDRAHAFTLSQLEPIEEIGAIVTETYRRAGILEPPEAHPLHGRDIRTKLYGSNGRRSPVGTPQLEIRARGGVSDYMTYRFATAEYVEALEQFP